MKRAFAFFMAAILLALTVMALAGCGADDDDTQPICLALVVGRHQKTKNINTADPTLVSLLERVVRSCGQVSFIVSDGMPQDTLVATQVERPSNYGQLSSSQQERYIQKQIATLQGILQAQVAKTPEVNTLAALGTAARALSISPEGSERHLYVMDTGVSTTGALKFQHPSILESEPEAIVDYLDALDAIPDLSNVDSLNWSGFMDCSSKQEVPTHYHKWFTAIWKGILEKAGSPEATFLGTPVKGDIDETDLPAVSPVTFPAAADGPAPKPQGAISIPESQLEFVPDSAEYRAPEQAIAVLQPIAAFLAQGSHTLVIAGTTASGDAQTCYELSLRRAQRVAATLQELGVDAARFEIYGLGHDDYFCIADRNPDGSYHEMATQNRRVFIYDADSEEYRQEIQEVRSRGEQYAEIYG